MQSLPVEWTTQAEWKQLMDPPYTRSFSDPFTKIEKIAMPIFIGGILSGAVAVSCLIGSYFFTASILAPVGIGAAGVAALAIPIIFVVQYYFQNQALAEVRTYVEKWPRNTTIEFGVDGATLGECLDQLSLSNLDDFISRVNWTKRTEIWSLIAIDYLARCAKLGKNKIESDSMVKKYRTIGLRDTLAHMKEEALLGGTMSTAERLHIWQLASDFSPY